jgi:lysozyme family protein
MDAGDDPLFGDAFAQVRRDEGGFQKNPRDGGNWTGGAVGVGELKGTNCGISAAAYPDLDIEHLSAADIESIYYRDWWCRYVFFAEIAHDDAVKAFDLAVNMGVHQLALLLQRACNRCGQVVAVDGRAGQLTVAAANACDSAALLAALKAEAEAFHREIAAEHPADAEFLAGWLRRDEE